MNQFPLSPKTPASLILIWLSLIILFSCASDDNGMQGSELRIISVKVGTSLINTSGTNEGLPIDRPIVIDFSEAVEETSLSNAFTLKSELNEDVLFDVSLINQRTTVSLKPKEVLKNNSSYTLSISENITSEGGSSLPASFYTFKTVAAELLLNTIEISGISLMATGRVQNISATETIAVEFSDPVDLSLFSNEMIILTSEGTAQSLDISFQEGSKVMLINPLNDLDYLTKYQLSLSSEISGTEERFFKGFECEFYTQIDSTIKFPEISDEELLTQIQETTFRYFWDFAHPISGLIRERNTSGTLVTIGGSGFGVMAILVGINRGFITRQEGVDRLEKIVNFLKTADRFHGVWPHWMNGATGVTIPFSADDDGADLVETSFMIQGLLTVRQYLDEGVAQEANIINSINQLWEEVEWDWFTQNDQNVLYWHWSPNFGWQKNLAIRGWNESLIVYVLAASSPTHAIDKEVYHEGWARSGGMVNGREFYGVTLPLGAHLGGPLFFSHYSFLGLDPRNLEDQYANYWSQNVNHSLINRAYCIDNPNDFVGYADNAWGLTASDSHNGYSAHSPNNDLGVITPTAAISSIPYTPEESLKAIRHFYYLMGDRIWGEYGFNDAYNITENWYADSYLAIDQGPIVCMIENYRTALLWDLFMSAPEIQNGLTQLEFTY